MNAKKRSIEPALLYYALFSIAGVGLSAMLHIGLGFVLSAMSLVFILIFLVGRGLRNVHSNFTKPMLAILAVSTLSWLAGQWWPHVFPTQQFYLIGSFVFGYMNREVTAWWDGIRFATQRMIVAFLCVAIAVAIAAYNSPALHGLFHLRDFTLGYLALICGWIPFWYHMFHQGKSYITGHTTR